MAESEATALLERERDALNDLLDATNDRIEGVARLATDLLMALQPWELQPQDVRSAAVRLTVALAAIPLPARAALACPPQQRGEK